MAFSGAFEGEADLHGLGWDGTGVKRSFDHPECTKAYNTSLHGRAGRVDTLSVDTCSARPLSVAIPEILNSFEAYINNDLDRGDVDNHHLRLSTSRTALGGCLRCCKVLGCCTVTRNGTTCISEPLSLC
jgi:hypothetical protein